MRFRWKTGRVVGMNRQPGILLFWGVAVSLFLAISAHPAVPDSWQATEAAAVRACKAIHFAEAERLLVANLKLAETLTAKDARRPRTLFDLAEVYRAEGKYNDAFPLYERALQIYTALYGHDATEIADTLDGEGELYTATGAFDKAEPLLLQALACRQKTPGPESAEVAQSFESLGTLYSKNGRTKQAEESFRQAVSIYGKTLGGDHPDYANALENLALCYGARRDFASAERLLQRVLEIR